MKNQQLFATLFVFFCTFSFSQTKEEVAKITKNYDVEKIQQKVSYYKRLAEREKEIAVEAALKNAWPILTKNNDGSVQELIKISPSGFPIYYSTFNVDAARSTRTNHINSGGSLGLNLNGQGMTARVWDGGTVRRTHNFLSSRITTVDDPTGTTYGAHPTHVTGTIISSSASGAAKGMAYQANARTFNWTNDLSEAYSESLLGMLISNHSYGVPLSSTPAWYTGAYSNEAVAWDELAFDAPYYLMVAAAGNDGGNSNSNPIATGYDKLNDTKTAKNNLVVANANDAVIAADGTLTSVTINSASSQGPTDDRRIKPDITGNGTGVTSTTSTSNTATTSMSGTSMASPNVAGTLLLLQQHNNNVSGSFMKSATLKGLVCHTADDAGNAGPDAKFGWGLLNAKRAVETINGNGLTSWVSEENMTQGGSLVMPVKATGTSPLIATITWTDVPGEANIGNRPVNDPTPALVNDLDIRITKDGVTTYYPWKLQSNPASLAIRTEDNSVDNVEQVKIDVPVSGEYIITVTHKGNLVNGFQNYSLIITGITSDFALISKSENVIACTNQDAVYLFDYKQSGVMTTTFSVVGLPSGASATFNPTSLSSDGPVTMTISGLTSVQPGVYNVGISGFNGTEVETRLKELRVYSNVLQPTILASPINGQDIVATSVFLNWDANINVENYNLQVSTQSNFSTLFLDVSTIETNYLITGLSSETTYYWRVVPSNRCGNALASASTVNNFRTGNVTCGNTFTATDFSNATIATTANSIATVPIQVTGGLTIGDINVSIDITHTYIQDMKYYLEGPAAIGSPIIVLFDEPCGDNDNISCTLDDAGINFTCGATAPSITGTVKPFGYLTTLNNLPADGTWILRVVDAYNGDGGSVNAVTLSICNIEQSLSATSNALAEIKVYPNPTKGILNINLGSDTFRESTFVMYDVQGRHVVTKKSSNTMETLNVENLSEGIYMLTIENDLGKTTKKVVINK